MRCKHKWKWLAFGWDWCKKCGTAREFTTVDKSGRARYKYHNPTDNDTFNSE